MNKQHYDVLLESVLKSLKYMLEQVDDIDTAKGFIKQVVSHTENCKTKWSQTK